MNGEGEGRQDHGRDTVADWVSAHGDLLNAGKTSRLLGDRCAGAGDARADPEAAALEERHGYPDHPRRDVLLDCRSVWKIFGRMRPRDENGAGSAASARPRC